MRRRNMFNLTGLPGWMRFGFSPGRGGGPGPCAQFLLSGQWQAMQGGAVGPVPDPSAQAQMLKSQAETLEAQLGRLREIIAQLEADQTSDTT